jgi:hypothetical protein
MILVIPVDEHRLSGADQDGLATGTVECAGIAAR